MRDHRYTSAYLFGAVCPERGVGAGVVMPTVNVDGVTTHLAEISRTVTEGAHAASRLRRTGVLDGAGWHTSPRLCVPDNVTLLPLPRCAPELNPVENLWEFLRTNFLSHRVWEGYEAIVDACCGAGNALMRMPERITSITRRAWAQVSI